MELHHFSIDRPDLTFNAIALFEFLQIFIISDQLYLFKLFRLQGFKTGDFLARTDA